ncbi:hypothetical protein DNTS_032176 [Danionella cerebrum]|uniref:Serpin domain-containing protein n=1 Tax=Danionella cerebrum TaxID=2873325 RepID=A0A553MWP4_9TELE|nr:hypothetical protein DNTS_032176 [Danionella translucida]TRY57590.1 hypothetical protein DNTS_032176 [Danionella translucida]
MLSISAISFLHLALVFPRISSSTTKEPKVQGPSQEIFKLHHPTWNLGLHLYRSLRINTSQTNTFISPLTLTNSLLGLVEGAKESTAGQFYDYPKLNKNELEKALTRELKAVQEYNKTSFIMHSSSALFSKEAPELETSFLEKLQTLFGVQHVAFENAPKQTDLEKLQSWAKSGMGGKETAVLKQPLDIKPGIMILANVLRFKGIWDQGFYHEEKDLRSFLGTKYTKVLMMHKSGVYHHYEDIKNMVQVLELGLFGGKASVVLLLPFHVEGLARLERLLTLDQLETWLGKLNSTSMAISLPRVNISSAVSLQKHLSALGLVDAQDETSADFSSASSQRQGNHLGAVLQWTTLELAPESHVNGSKPEEEDVKQPKIFYADHSFIILVKDNSSGALLLMGALDHTDGPSVHDEL